MAWLRDNSLECGVRTLGLTVICMGSMAGWAGTRSAVFYAADGIIPHPATVLLRNESVGRELRLDVEERAVVRRAVDEVDLALWRLRDRARGERARESRPLLARLEGNLSRTLTSRQLGRFNQILLQAQGMSSLLVDEVARRLLLTSRQTEQIRTALDALGAELAHARQRDPPSARRIQAEVERNIVALLHSRQRQKLLALMGEGFDLSRIRNIACPAPALRGVTTWLNSEPLTLDDLRGKVIVVHFYTFGCINCVRNLPHYNAWRQRFDPTRVALIGIHTPETETERDVERVRQKAAEAGIAYPVAVDNDRANWDAWANNVWPAVYLIDKQGFVRYWWYGELAWQSAPGEKWMRSKIAELLAEQPPVLTAAASRSPNR